MEYSTIADIIKNIIEQGKAEGIKCTLTNLRKIIKWIPSKFNDYTKDILDMDANLTVEETDIMVDCY